MGLRLIDELLADQKEELLRQGEKRGEKKGKKEGETTERLRLLTEQLQASLGDESSAFIEALPTLKPIVHDKIANLLVTVRGKKKLIKMLHELSNTS